MSSNRALIVTALAGLTLACAVRAPAPAPPPGAPMAMTQAENKPPAVVDAVEERARAFINELATARWEHPATPFNATMARLVPAAKLHAMWAELEDAGGPFVRVTAVARERKDDLQIAKVTCAFQRLRKVVRVVFDGDSRVTGLFHGPVPEDIEAKSRSLIDALARADYDGASRDFGANMKTALPPSALAGAWAATLRQAGPWQSIEGIELRAERGHWLSLATAHFERDRMLIKIAYDVREEIVGLFFVPVPVSWTSPAYATPEALEEREVVVGASPPLPGTLTLPKAGRSPFAAVVLVHGSGPNDRDETVGGVKVFKDLAWGLANRGIAVVRYEKRSRVSPAGVVTQKEEVVDGACDALALLRQMPEIDSRRIFLLGHSQGGTLAPRIASARPELAGLIIMAGATRSMGQIVVDQYTYFSELAPESPEARDGLEAARRFKRTFDDPALRPDQEVEFPDGTRLSGAYLLDDRAYDPGKVAAKLARPMLLLQGLRDYQATMTDFQGWRAALRRSKRATFKTYPALNHLFVAGTGKPTPAEYQQPGHVDAQVISDIAGWVTARADSP